MMDDNLTVLLVCPNQTEQAWLRQTLDAAGHPVITVEPHNILTIPRSAYAVVCMELDLWRADMLDAPTILLVNDPRALITTPGLPLDFLQPDSTPATAQVVIRSALQRYNLMQDASRHRQQSETLDNLVHNTVLVSPDGIAILIEDDTVVFANPALQGLLKQDYVGQGFPFRVKPSEVLKVKWSDDHQPNRTLEVRAVPVDWQGQPARLVALRDITHQIEAETEVQALYRATTLLLNWESPTSLGERIIQALHDQLPHIVCGVWLKDMMDMPAIAVTRLAASPAYPYASIDDFPAEEADLWQRQLDAPVYYQPTRIKPDTWRWLIPIEDGKSMLGILDLHSTQHDGFDLQTQRILLTFVRHSGAVIHMMRLQEMMNGYAEILETRVAERTVELQRAKEHAEAILKNINDMVILLDADGTIQQVNSAFTQSLGYDSDEITLLPLSKLFEASSAPQVDQLVADVLAQRQTVTRELTIRHKNTDMHVVDAAFAPVVPRQGAPSQIVCSLHDITLDKQYEAGLREALERERELGEMKMRFTSMVSHEFRTPLAIMMLSINVLRDYFDRLTLEKREYHLEKIYLQVQRLTQLLTDVLVISRSDVKGMAFNPAWLDLAELCQAIILEIRETHNPEQRIYITRDGDCSSAYVDEALLRHILQNLVTNALKYSPNERPIHVRLWCDESDAYLEVQDEGIGIPLTSQVHLFEAFHRADNVDTIPGTGLGLVIVKRAVETHGGTISFESQQNHGTTFRVCIPIYPQQ
jgi:PAS domain S-box-containing protein